MIHTDHVLLAELNNNLIYDNSTLLNKLLHLEDTANTFSNTHLHSKYYDHSSIISKFKNCKLPLILSTNIQSLMSKFDQLKNFILELTNAGISIDIIALQEIWQVHDTNLVNIPGFHQLLSETRNCKRGGGVGFYINNNLKFKKLISPAGTSSNIFECITIQVHHPTKFIISNIYHSPTPLQGSSNSDHFNAFIEKFDSHLSFLTTNYKNSHIIQVMDSNINSFNIETNHHSFEFFSTSISNGFIHTNTKATRIQNNSFSLIDQILSNDITNNNITGTIISDISDHFINFLQLNKQDTPKTRPTKTFRNFTQETIQNFNRLLSDTDWTNVLACNDVDDCFELFWGVFHELYELNFPLKTTYLNKNVHKLNNFMTIGLLTSRNTKSKLHKQALLDPSAYNISRYRSYRNIYNTVLRLSKKLYFEKNLNENAKNPRKSWELLKEALNSNNNQNKIESIQINGLPTDNSQDIAEEFNKFFSTAGVNVASSINPSCLEPDDFIPPNPNPPELSLGLTSPATVHTTIQNFESKNSLDLDGISTSLLKAISIPISLPLSHIFNLSISNGIFPNKL